MSVVKGWKNVRVVWDQGNDEGREDAILVHSDMGGSLVLEQDGRCIVLPRKVNELLATIREVDGLRRKDQ